MNGSKYRASKTIAIRVAVVILTVLVLVLASAYGVMWILVNGPSPTAKRLFVLSVKETSAGGFLAHIYLSDEEIAEIVGSGKHSMEEEEKTDTSLISIPDKESEDTQPDESDDIIIPSESDISESETQKETDTEKAEMDTEGDIPQTELDATDGIEVVDVVGSTYNGKMLIISDPSRVFVGVPDAYGPNCYGLTVASMIEKYDCIAGTNAGGFYDPNGKGTGGIPEGIVIYEGELLWGELGVGYSIAGLDKNGILHVGWMTAENALDIGIQYAASYGPALVINGKHAGGGYILGGGLNPRTAIGQRADGAILLLVINGRSLGSLGATLDDLAEIMIGYGAVNATNLDGGSSSLMILDGEYLTSSSYIFGERVVATSILVRKQ
ncbi:MAG: phosphodiester glycosidase family protein [Ruminococcaceae bacterium]|nr:phosphodiester glycosidase family protein [Oscillospiraceae bacterium]